MPLYSFQISEAKKQPLVLEPLQLSSDDEAWEEAIKACGEQIRDVGGELPRGGELVIVVSDHARSPIFTIKLSTEAHRAQSA